MITTFYPPYNFGGDGIFVHQLSNELAKRGHYVDVIHCIDSYRLLANHEPTSNYNDHPNVTVHGLKSRFGFLSPLATQQTGYPLFKSDQLKRILEKGFDVIHYHNISLVGGPKILEYGHGIKLYTMHEYWLVCPTHVLFRFNRKACLKPHCFFCTLAYKRPPQWWRYSGLLESAAKKVDAFITMSNFSREIHYQMGFKIPIVSLPPFPYWTESILPIAEESIGQTLNQPYFLFVGRLEKLKGLQTLIPIFRRCKEAQLLIVGKGSYEPNLRKLAGNATNIQFLGHLSQRELRPLYRNAVALIVPSICFEVFPLVIIEAFSQQTPVIVRDIGGMKEIVEESGGGIAYNTEEELMTSMDRLLMEPSYRSNLGISGYEAFQSRFTAEAHLRHYLSLIKEISVNRRPQVIEIQ
jgi:glycosyltransferase involved in cell wall biosynthesis